MHEFIQSGELRAQVKRLLGFRLPLIMAIIVNIVLIARIPNRQETAQAQGPELRQEDGTGLTLAPSDEPIVDTEASFPSIAMLPTASPPTKFDSVQLLPLDVDWMYGPTDWDKGLMIPNDPAPLPATEADSGEPELDTPNSEQADVPTQVAGTVQDETTPDSTPYVSTEPLLLHTRQLVQDWQESAKDLIERLSRATVHGIASIENVQADPVEDASTTPQVTEAPDVNRGSDKPSDWLERGLAIRNPASNDETVRFLVDGRLCELQPGEAHWFAPREDWHIQFHRGGEFGNVDRQITKGTFGFASTDQGWDLIAE